jgi:hypothetical protein
MPALQLINPLGNWLTNAQEQRNWTYHYYHNDIIKLSNPYQYYTQIPNRHHQQTYQLQHQYVIVPQNISTPAIPFYITTEILSCHDTTHANLTTADPNLSTTCQPANITYTNDIKNNNLIIETIQILCEGKIDDEHITIGSALYINGTKAITCKGKLKTTNNSANIVINTYSTHYLLQQFLITTTQAIYSANITLLIDDRILISRINKLNRKIYPNACQLPEYEIINAINIQLNHIPNITIRF